MKQFILLSFLISLFNTQIGMQSESVSISQVPSLVTLCAKNLSVHDARQLINNDIETQNYGVPIENLTTELRKAFLDMPLFQDICRSHIKTKSLSGCRAAGFNRDLQSIITLDTISLYSDKEETKNRVRFFDLNMDDNKVRIFLHKERISDIAFKGQCAQVLSKPLSSLHALKEFKKILAPLVSEDILFVHPHQDIILTNNANRPRLYLNFSQARSFKTWCEQEMPLMQILLIKTINPAKKDNQYTLSEKEQKIYNDMPDTLKQVLHPHVLFHKE